MGLPWINDKEEKVLKNLNKLYDDEGGTSRHMKIIAKQTGLNIKETRRACRSLRKKGLVDFKRGLFYYDGSPAGSGYMCNKEGNELAAEKNYEVGEDKEKNNDRKRDRR